MPTVRPATALAVLLVLAGCTSACGSGSGSRSGSDKASTEPPPDKAFTEPPPCNPEGGQPISEATLKAVLARSGIRLYRDDRCEEFRDPNYAALPLLRRMVAAGQLGRKSGSGFYDYRK